MTFRGALAAVGASFGGGWLATLAGRNFFDAPQQKRDALSGAERPSLAAAILDGPFGIEASYRVAAARLSFIAIAAVIACRSTDSVQPQARVYFSLDAPLCSSVLPAQFFIDSLLIGTDTFRVNLAPNHTTSRAFATAPGTHVLGARVALGALYYPWPATPDTVVTLNAGTTYTRVLPFYCS